MKKITSFFETKNAELKVTLNEIIARIGYVEIKVTKKKGKFYLNVFALDVNTWRVKCQTNQNTFFTEESCLKFIKRHQYDLIADAMYEVIYALQEEHKKEVEDLQRYIDYLY